MSRFFVVMVFVTFLTLAYVFDLSHYLNLPFLKENIDDLRSLSVEHKWSFMGLFFLIYTLSTAVSIPGAVVLTLAAGAIFGFAVASVLVSFASTVGATLAFLAARYVMKDFVQEKFASKRLIFNQGIAEEGHFYLFSLRLIPLVWIGFN